jgi:sugar phosphate isomerase/epimerase
MNLGIFAKTYERPSVEGVFGAAAADGLTSVQFNFVTTGLAPMPDSIDPTVVERVRAAADAWGITIASLSATFNLIHPDPEVRETGHRRLEVLAAVSRELGSSVLSLCTGTRDPDNMWRHHPDNDRPDAWSDVLTEIGRAISVAERHGLVLGIEPEPGNVVSTAERARRLLDETGSSHLGIVLDPANLIEGVAPDRINDVIDEGIALLGERTIVAHGKDRDAAGTVRPPGLGVVPWHRFLDGLRSVGFSGPLILHGLSEAEVPAAASHLRDVLLDAPAG